MNIDEILEDWEVFSSKLDNPSKLLDYLVFSTDDRQYIRRDPYGPQSGGLEEVQEWQDFIELAKHDRRFHDLFELGEGKPSVRRASPWYIQSRYSSPDNRAVLPINDDENSCLSGQENIG